MAAAQIAQPAIDVFSAYYRQLEQGVTGYHRRGQHRAPHRSRSAQRRLGGRRPGRGGALGHGDDQAQRRPRHLDGDGAGQVPAPGPRRPHVPGPDRGAGPRRPGRVRGQAAADVHEQLPHPGRHAGRAGPVRRPGRRRSRPRLPAEPGAQAPRRRPDPGGVAGRPEPGVVPARPRRPLHLAGHLRRAGSAARARLPVRLGVQLRQPRGRPERHASPAGSPPAAPRTPRSCAGGRRRIARAVTWPSARPTGS